MESCPHDQTIGKFKEFMDSMKGFKTILGTISFAIVVQVMTFLFLWGSLTTTVKANDKYMWTELSPKTTENTRNIDRIMTRLEGMLNR